MANRAARMKVTKVVTLILAVGLVFNLVSDFWAYQTFKESNLLGEEVVKASNAEMLLQKIDREIGMRRSAPDQISLKAETQDNVDALNDLLSEHDEQSKLYLVLQSHLLSAKSGSEVEPILNKMILNQTSLLQKAIVADRMANKRLQSDLMKAIALDIVLLLTLGGLYLVESRARQVIEENLNSANESFKKLNLVLEARLSEQLEKNKMMIHDLKNPLGTIRGFAELILDENPESATIQEFSAAIRGSSERTLRLVDSLLLSDGADRFDDGFAKIDVIPVLNAVSSEFALKAKIKSQTIKVELPLGNSFIFGNAEKLQNLFGNLIGNSIKYSDRNTLIWVRCFADQHSLHIEIEDQGPGFSAEDKIKAFHYGQTLSAKSTSGESSTGFGLFACKQIVEAHRGSIVILDSKAAHGAIISVVLPLLS